MSLSLYKVQDQGSYWLSNLPKVPQLISGRIWIWTSYAKLPNQTLSHCSPTPNSPHNPNLPYPLRGSVQWKRWTIKQRTHHTRSVLEQRFKHSAVGAKRREGKQENLLMDGDRGAGSRGISRVSETWWALSRVKCTSKEEYSNWMATPSSGAAGNLGAMKKRTDEVQWQQLRLECWVWARVWRIFVYDFILKKGELIAFLREETSVCFFNRKIISAEKLDWSWERLPSHFICSISN